MIFIIVIINLNCLQFNQAYQVGLVGLAEVGDELVAEVVALLETGTLTTAARMEISLSLVGSLKIGISRVIMEQGVEHMELEVERWRLLDGRRHGTQQKRDGLKIYLLTSGAGTSTLGSGSKV